MKIFWYLIILYGCIDGYSRLIVYVKCSSKNFAATFLNFSEKAIKTHDLPSRIQGDRGSENIEVVRYVLTHPNSGLDCGSFITGHSVHSQRIERLWIDVYYGVTPICQTVFLTLGQNGALDFDSEIKYVDSRIKFDNK